MINIDDRLLDLLPKIKGDSLAILLLITKRINRKNEAFPSRATLMKESGYGKDTVDKCLKILKENGLISAKQRHLNGKLASNNYTIETDYLGVFVSAKGFEVTENQVTENQVTENQVTENQVTENQTVSIKQSSRSIKQDLEVLNIPEFSNFPEKPIDLSDKSDESSNLGKEISFLTPNTESLNQEISLLKSQSLIPKPKEIGQFSNEQIEVKPKNNYPCEVFNRLWAGYLSFSGTRIGNKGDAYKAWLKVKNKASPQDFEKATAAYSLTESVRGNRKGEKFIMQFSRFLSSGRWETELDMAGKTLETHNEKSYSAMDELRAKRKQEELQKTGRN